MIGIERTNEVRHPHPAGLYPCRSARHGGGLHFLSQRALFAACFTARMPMRTKRGSILAALVQVGDKLLSRNEHDPDGEIVESVVEEVFVRDALVMELKVAGQVIETTAEHPLYVADKGWANCNELQVGDIIRTEEGWSSVEAVVDTGRWETVYNFRIAEHHTYFVGCNEWGFSVWAHNATCGIEDVRNAIGKRGSLAEGELRYVSGLLNKGEHLEARAYLASKGVNIDKQSVRQLIAEHSPYANPKNRPSYASGQVEEVWNNAATLDRKGRVFDPHTGEQLFWDRSVSRYDQWHMGHLTDHEYSTLHGRFMQDKISQEEFLSQYRNPRNYYPESPTENMSHRHEAPR